MSEVAFQPAGPAGASHWTWSLTPASGGGARGTVIARDPRDALSRALTTARSGILVGEKYGVPVDVLAAAPGNSDSHFTTQGAWGRIEVRQRVKVTIDVQIDMSADDSGEIQLWARGRHDSDAFLAACEAKLLAYYGVSMSVAGMQSFHEHRRSVRANAEVASYGVCDRVHVTSKPGPGAFAVTVLTDWLQPPC